MIRENRKTVTAVGVDGALLVLSPLPLLFYMAASFGGSLLEWHFFFAVAAVVACIGCAAMLFKRPVYGKCLGAASLAGTWAASFPYLISNPSVSLAAAVVTIAGMVGLIELKVPALLDRRDDAVEVGLRRVRWAAYGVPVVVVCALFTGTMNPHINGLAVSVSSVIAQIFYFVWLLRRRLILRMFVPVAGIMATVVLDAVSGFWEIAAATLLISIATLAHLPLPGDSMVRRESWWELLMNHPARLLITTFLALCVFGTLLLSVPVMTAGSNIRLIDAAFTAVSAVCVTGLTVIDTRTGFSAYGQGVILLLIQMGGLGIMTIATVGLHAMGRRLSLAHERIITSITDPGYSGLVRSLVGIIVFTLIAEVAGALLLTAFFHMAGDAIPQAVWRGVFTAVSAFCNAGFALQGDSLAGYASSPAILNTVAILIVAGGLAPAVCMMIPRLVAGKRIPESDRIILVTTFILLVSGTLLFLAFEWNGILSGLPFDDKICNAWFQSVTLRTAGFNSVPIASVTDATLLFMLFFMFVGGSPGGTAGGIKTTTAAVIAMTFRSGITNRQDVKFRNRQIHPQTVYRAITIIVAGVIVCLITVVMLFVTQNIAARDLVFEAVSALGTVGLSTGATFNLDEIGKVIIMMAMFAGRVGPVTLFMLQADERSRTDTGSPFVKITLT